jgi:hypothetical protein
MIMKMRKKMLKELKISQMGEMMFLTPSGINSITGSIFINCSQHFDHTFRA